MIGKPTHGLFIAGTSTGVGKTYVAALIAESLVRAGMCVGVYKPAASGCSRDGTGNLVSDDAIALWNAAGRPRSLAEVCPQCFAAPLAPHLAAAAEGRAINAELLRTGLAVWQASSDIVIVEGAGGLMSPLGAEDYVADLALEFGYPLVVVAANELGVINQTLQTLIVASVFREGINVAGVVLNTPRGNADLATDPSIASNRVELEARCVPPILGEVTHSARDFDRPIDWQRLAGVNE